MVRVIVGYSDKLDSIVVDGEPVDISAISEKNVREWFKPSGKRDGWRGLIKELYSLLADDEVEFSFEFSGAKEIKKQFEECLREAGIVNNFEGNSEEEIAQENFEKGQQAEHVGNYPVALKYYETAANSGHIRGALAAAEYYYKDKGLEGKRDRNAELYHRYELLCKVLKKESKNAQDKKIQAEAKVLIGKCFLHGKGVEKNEKKALEYLKEAAQDGNAEGACICGECYEEGIGVERDSLSAVKYYEYSADKNYCRGLAQLGRCYTFGIEGIEKDIDKGIKLLKKSTEQEDSIGEFNLGLCYIMGYGIETNIEDGKKLIKKSADANNAEAQRCMGDMYFRGEYFEENDKEAVVWYTKAAQQGDAKAQFMLGECYFWGWGTEEYYEKAVDWFQKASDQGDLAAEGFIGICYYHGYGIEQNFELAFKHLYNARGEENAYIQLHLGLCYYNGNGIGHDYKNAVKWFEKSAEQGDRDAQNFLGDCYTSGKGVAQNSKEASKWYGQSAEQGNIHAQLKLGCNYFEGDGVEQNFEESAKWFQKAAEQGEYQARGLLGVHYYLGLGVEQSYDKAVNCFLKSIKDGGQDVPSNVQYYMGKCYLEGTGIEKDINQGFKWLNEAANKEDAEAQCELGHFYEKRVNEGEAKKKNREEKIAWVKEKEELYKNAAMWYKKAAENGSDEGRELLGACYISGLGVEKNLELGARYIEQAANNEAVWAQNFMGKAYKNGVGVKKNVETSMQWYKKAAENGDGESHYIIAESLYEVAVKGGGKKLAIAMGLGAIIPFSNAFTLPAALIFSKLSRDEKLKKFLETDEGKLMYGHYKSAVDLGYTKAADRLQKLNKLIGNKNN